jgi:cation diffusion facilitator CzcD-associated flavoprotein CzcO
MALIDAGRLVPERPIQPDLCIVGAGAAGITLAREFIGTRYACRTRRERRPHVLGTRAAALRW